MRDSATANSRSGSDQSTYHSFLSCRQKKRAETRSKTGHSATMVGWWRTRKQFTCLIKQRTRRLEIRRERLRVTRLHLPKEPLLIPARWCHQRAQNRAGRWEPFERSVSSACALWTIRARYSRAKVVNRHRSRRHTPKAAEVHFSTRLLAHQRLASTRRGAVDFTTPLHP